MGTNEADVEKERRKNAGYNQGEYIKLLYSKLVGMGYLYKDLYDMTIVELEGTYVNKREEMAYEIWRLASLTRSPFAKNFPKSPQDACPELFQPKKGIKMPSFLIEKAIKRGVL